MSSTASHPTDSDSTESRATETRATETHVSETQASAVRPELAPDGRQICWLENGILRPTENIRRTTTSSFQGFIDPEGVNWKSLSPSTIDIYYDEFKKAFTWDGEVYSSDVIRKTWISQARHAYKNFVHGCKVIIDEGSRPQFLHKDIVTKWKEYWATPEFQVKSQQASKNRRSEHAGPGTGISIHYGGSRSAISHAEHVAREKNISIADAHYDTFMRMHFKKGQFDGRAQTQGLEIHSRVEELRSTLGRDVTLDEVSQIYREVVTLDPKGRRLGLGIMSQMRSTGSTSTHSTCSSQFPSAAVSAQIAQLQTELEQTQQREVTL
ncbi:uncharacterized protein LOC131012655 [Salvia miltiorrhiza]|uniref:uncharacterized protein LOC131003631 n=1 Tax=Salvia miltiorrhiza TaxID=226208 RepID=UPI0025ACE592|nr:uncharacterized protein LOC131003631 [Salvia miltiorrhiza]XP_057796627.1 uncharacterized protein LOC131012655 [Salvia miltiorrhiza]